MFGAIVVKKLHCAEVEGMQLQLALVHARSGPRGEAACLPGSDVSSRLDKHPNTLSSPFLCKTSGKVSRNFWSGFSQLGPLP